VTEQRLEVTETSDEQVTIQFDGLTIELWRSSLDKDRGQPVVQIDGSGMLRVNVNDYPIWNADPDDHEHHECLCVADFEATGFEDDDGEATDGDLIGPLVAVDESGTVTPVFNEDDDA
jgi:hypothetical protein